MKCDDAYQGMLVSEPSELRGIGDSAVAAHVRTCEQCGARAARILEANALLSQQLGGWAQLSRPPARIPAWLPIPIAAAIAGLMLMNQPVQTTVPRVGSLEDVKRPATTTIVNAPTNGDVAVIRAADNVTVVWNLRAGGGS